MVTLLTLKSRPSRAKVYIDDELIGTTTIKDHRISKGVYKIRFEKSGYKIKTYLNYRIKERDLAKALTAKLTKASDAEKEEKKKPEEKKKEEPKPSAPTKKQIKVDIRAVPEIRATVDLNGRVIGSTPIINHDVEIGNYRIILRKEGYFDSISNREIKSGDLKRVWRIDMVRKTTTPTTPTPTPPTPEREEPIRLPTKEEKKEELKDDIIRLNNERKSEDEVIRLGGSEPELDNSIKAQIERAKDLPFPFNILGNIKFTAVLGGILAAILAAPVVIAAMARAFPGMAAGATKFAVDKQFAARLGVGAVSGLAGTDTLAVWLASDNIMSTSAFHIKTLKESVKAGNLTNSEAMAEFEKVQGWANVAEELIRKSVTFNPLLIPFKGVFIANVEMVQSKLNLEKEILKAQVEKKSLISDRDLTKIEEAKFKIKFLKDSIKKKTKEMRREKLRRDIKILKSGEERTEKERVNEVEKKLELMDFKKDVENKIMEERVKILALSKGYTIAGARSRIKYEGE